MFQMLYVILYMFDTQDNCYDIIKHVHWRIQDLTWVLKIIENVDAVKTSVCMFWPCLY